MSLFRALQLRPAMLAGIPTFEYGDVTEEQGADLEDFLARYRGRAVVLRIASVGGDAMQGAADAEAVESHGDVRAVVAGMAMSAATLPLVAARTRWIHDAGMAMIHDPSALTTGTADRLRQTAGTLDQIAGVYAEFYARRTGQPVERIRAWMNLETWFTPEEAVATGFADRIVTGPSAAPAQAVARFDLTAFRNVPPELRARLTATGGAALPPEDPKNEV